MNRFFLLFLMFPTLTFAQFYENWNKSNLTEPPTWSGHLTNFSIDNNTLHLNAPPEASTSYIATESKAINNATWEFSLTMDFNPSSSNLSEIYIISNQPEFNEDTEGYFVKIGGTKDEISLWKKTNGKSSKIIDGTDKVLDKSSVYAAVKVERDEKGNWKLYTQLENAPYLLEGETFDNSIVKSEYFLLVCKYTSTRSSKFHYGPIDVQGSAFVDDTPPDSISLNTNRYDVVISEIMIDPTPSAGVFESEYIELYNNTAETVNLGGWNIFVNNKPSALPSFDLKPDKYVAITDLSEIHNWPNSLNLIGVEKLPALPNSSGEIILSNNNNVVIEALKYPLPIDEKSFKNDGGWAIERMDNTNYDVSSDNWRYSVNLDGGTPGCKNSVADTHADTNAPKIKYISYMNDSTFKFHFSEPMDTSNWKIYPPININFAEIYSINIDSIYLNSASLTYTKCLNHNISYLINFEKDLRDYAGNTLKSDFDWKIGIPEPIDSFDLCINEILFNPTSESTDFIEIYNRSNQIINSDNIYTSSISQGIPEKLYPINAKSRLIFPEEYIVITADSNKLNGQYQTISECVIQTSIPSMNDDEGYIALTTSNGKIIDHFQYTEKLHFELLRDKEGVSLERIDYNATTNNPNNWHSASSETNFATPTKMNSQYVEKTAQKSDRWIWLEDDEFTPDGDGTADFLQINYALQEPGWSGSVTIFNRYGIPIKILNNNDLLGTSGFFKWDGITDKHSKAPLGIYLIYAEFFSIKGKVKKKKMTAVLSLKAS